MANLRSEVSYMTGWALLESAHLEVVLLYIDVHSNFHHYPKYAHSASLSSLFCFLSMAFGQGNYKTECHWKLPFMVGLTKAGCTNCLACATHSHHRAY